MIAVNESDYSWSINSEKIDNFNKYYNKSRILIEEYLTRHISIAITNNCNMNCNYCYKSINNEKTIKEIPFDSIKKFIDFILMINNNIETVQLIGGEPTIHKGFISICEYIVNKGLQLRISTNGSYLGFMDDNRFIELLKKVI